MVIYGYALVQLGAGQASAGALDWLTHRKSDPRTAQSGNAAETPKVEKPGSADLPGFFQNEAQTDLTGNSLRIIAFAESHWLHSKKSMESISKSISAKIPAKRCSDISEKLYAININTLKESLKTSATCIDRLEQGTKNLESLVTELGRIITAPREETMSNLEKAIARVQAVNGDLFKIAKSNVAGSEALINIGGEAYQTLELIPTLSVGPIDVFVQGSKQLMKQIQSNNEALKGLLLNVQSSCEQTVSCIELMLTTIKTTLRYSDHFAFKQYPLVNLPVPVREKLFSQMGALQNVVKGINNTLAIGNSHVKNSAQQFSHQIDGMTTKIKDSLQYVTAVDLTSGNLPQISVYAQNQVSGLYQRTRDGVNEMRSGMAKVLRDASAGGPPQVSLETGEDAQVRKASTASENRLPLFLLGGKDQPVKTTLSNKSSAPLEAPTSNVTVLYTEKPAIEPISNGFRPEEMEILQKELGNNGMQHFSKLDGATEEFDQFKLPDQKGKGDLELLQSFNPIPANPSGRLDDGNSGEIMATNPDRPTPSEKGDFEVMPIDGGGFQESGDLVPMLRMDEPLNSGDRE